jgi:hypothetical protein
MSEVSPAAQSDSGTALRMVSNVHHLCRMELAGGGQVVIDGQIITIPAYRELKIGLLKAAAQKAGLTGSGVPVCAVRRSHAIHGNRAQR